MYKEILNKIVSCGERLQTENSVIIGKLGYLESAASTVCNHGDICIASPCIQREQFIVAEASIAFTKRLYCRSSCKTRSSY